MPGDLVRTYRSLARRPGFFLAIVLTFALGIGANSAIFSVIDAVLLKPLPYPDGDRLMALYESNPQKRIAREAVAGVRIGEWARLTQSFTGITGAYTESFAETSGALPEKLVSARVANEFFTVLGTPMALGRGFIPDEERTNGPQAVVISERFWERRFGRDPQTIGKVLRAAGRAYPIVGVAPASFRFPAEDVDLWLPAKLPDVVMRMREARFFTTVGRLKPGVAERAARADLVAVQARLGMQYPASDANWTAILDPLKSVQVGGVRRSLWVLFAAVSLVLAIACTNVACLLLAQANRREREIAVRFSLGAGRWRVVQQMLKESLYAALPGAALGLAMASWGAEWFRTAAAHLPRAAEVRLDWRIVAFTAAVTLLTALGCGLIPALAATRRQTATGLAHGGRGQVGGRQGLLRGLVAAQIALAIVLLVGAGLLIRTLGRLGQSELGFDPERILTLHISAGWGEKNDTRQVERRFSRTLEGMRSIPGVEEAALTITLPGTGEYYPGEFSIEGRAPGPKTFADMQSVSPEFFKLMRIPILTGETCRVSLDQKLPDAVLVNRAFMNQFLAGENPIGRRIKLSWTTAQIQGVVGDIRDHGYAQDPRPVVYSCGFPGFYPDPAFLLRTRSDPAHMLETVRRKIQEMEPNRAVYDARPMTEVLDGTLALRRFQTALLTGFGATALALAMVGLYGVMSFFVSQRGREMGLRAALGASPSQILGHVFRQGAWMTGAGIAIGVSGAAMAVRWLETLLFGITPWDLLSFAAAPALLATAAVLAIWIPARRATRIDPMLALKDD